MIGSDVGPDDLDHHFSPLCRVAACALGDRGRGHGPGVEAGEQFRQGLPSPFQ